MKRAAEWQDDSKKEFPLVEPFCSNLMFILSKDHCNFEKMRFVCKNFHKLAHKLGSELHLHFNKYPSSSPVFVEYDMKHLMGEGSIHITYTFDEFLELYQNHLNCANEKNVKSLSEFIESWGKSNSIFNFVVHYT